MKIAEKDLVFFAAPGAEQPALTSASALSVSNNANELVREINAQLGGVNFLNMTMVLASGGQVYNVKKGIGKTDLESLTLLLEQKAELYDLVSWIQEGIKAKSRIQDLINKESMESWAQDNGKTIPVLNTEDIPCPVMPTKYAEPDKDELLGFLSPEERSRYFSLLSKVSVISKFIGEYTEHGMKHTGAMLDARKDLLFRMQHPIEEKGAGADTKVYTYSPSVDPVDVETVYFSLQARHREYQKELNGMMARMEKEGNRVLTERIAEYEKARLKYDADLKEYELARSSRTKEYWRAKDILQEEFSAWKRKESETNQQRRIVIPARLLDVYNTVNQVANK